jgi:putative Mg2+ transporter-C (MgtC) family protein
MDTLNDVWLHFRDTAPDAGVKLLLAVFLAGAVGFEREFRGRPAGLRTHILVCLGATLMMIVSDLIAKSHMNTGQDVWLDSGRIAAGIITGVGFLGAGTIMNRGGAPHGLTTAAMIWFVAAIGVAIGANFHAVAIVATAFALATVVGLRHLERRMNQRRYFHLRVNLAGSPTDFQKLEDLIHTKAAFRVSASRLEYLKTEGRIKTEFQIEAGPGGNFHTLLAMLEEKFPEAEAISIEH